MPGFNLKNMGNLMKQARQMKKAIKSKQQKIANTHFIGKAPRNLVVVDFTGNRQMQNLKINPKIINPKDPDTLTDLIIGATNDAMAKIDKTNKESLGKYVKGLK